MNKIISNGISVAPPRVIGNRLARLLLNVAVYWNWLTKFELKKAVWACAGAPWGLSLELGAIVELGWLGGVEQAKGKFINPGALQALQGVDALEFPIFIQ